jgi:hypothetical protein
MWPISEPIAAIMPPISLLKRPAPIIGITTVWAMNQSATPQMVPRLAGEPGLSRRGHRLSEDRVERQVSIQGVP